MPKDKRLIEGDFFLWMGRLGIFMCILLIGKHLSEAYAVFPLYDHYNMPKVIFYFAFLCACQVVESWGRGYQLKKERCNK